MLLSLSLSSLFADKVLVTLSLLLSVSIIAIIALIRKNRSLRSDLDNKTLKERALKDFADKTSQDFIKYKNKYINLLGELERRASGTTKPSSNGVQKNTKPKRTRRSRKKGPNSNPSGSSK